MFISNLYSISAKQTKHITYFYYFNLKFISILYSIFLIYYKNIEFKL